jgi:methylphosphotriester-DNA--protein-cysteine methyltransferase
MKIKPCDWCDNTFETDISYQIYCSPKCREQATKEKIALRYAATRRNNKNRKLRTCKDCGTKLSVYNDDVLCQSCEIVPGNVLKALKDVKRLANGKDK